MGSRRWVGVGDMLVALVVAALLVLMLMATLPRQRAGARAAACRRNLARIGVALVLFDQNEAHLPTVPELGPGAEVPPMSGPLAQLLAGLGQSDFDDLTDPKAPPPRPGAPGGPRRVAGFLCPSDPQARGAEFPAPVSYRATAGDRTEGGTGAFAPGRAVRLADVEEADGLAFTAAFSERLLGTGRDRQAVPVNYAEVPGPVPPGGCPAAGADSWRGDAGASWAVAGWGSTLYAHALVPNASPSCLAADARSALMGASSAHPSGVHVLRFDGSVTTTTPRVDPAVWRALGAMQDSLGTPPTSR